MPIARILDTRAIAVWRLQAAQPQHDIMIALYSADAAKAWEAAYCKRIVRTIPCMTTKDHSRRRLERPRIDRISCTL